MYRVIVLSFTKFIGERFEKAVEFSQPNATTVVFANISIEIEQLDEAAEFAKSFVHDKFAVMIYDSKKLEVLMNTASVFKDWSWTLLK